MKVLINNYNPGISTVIEYGFARSVFGEVLIARTAQGICVMEFADDRQEAVRRLENEWSQCQILYSEEFSSVEATDYILPSVGPEETVELCVRGTKFQTDVWEALLRIPFGQTVSYSDVARLSGHETAVRTVASAIASNYISLIIPCHRVVRKNGETGKYRWGSERKAAIIDWERNFLRKK